MTDGAFARAAELFAELQDLDVTAAAARLSAESDAEVRELVQQMLDGARAPLPALTEGLPGLRELVDDAFEGERRAASTGGTPPGGDEAEPDFALAAGPYRVEGVLGRGGMGIVYRGRDESIGRAVAIKVLRGGTREQLTAHLRFVEEAQVAGQLEHPGIVPIHHLGRDDHGRPFFVMKLIEGRTLAELLAGRQGPRHDQGRFLGQLLRVCQTVAYAHARGVIHRDLKPANVMVGAFGEVQVLDWGLAKVLGAASAAESEPAAGAAGDGAAPSTGAPTGARPTDRPTTARSTGTDGASLDGTVMGTPGYMPPEQALGAVADLDRRADVFALGAILCEILTGQPPFPGGRRQAWQATRDRALAPAFDRLARCGADPALVTIARRCLSADREERPVDAGDLAAAIERTLGAAEQRAHDAMLEAERATARAASERLARRRTVWLSGVSALFLVGLIAVLLWHSFERDRAIAGRSAEVENALEVATERLDRAGRADVEDLEPWRSTAVALEAAERIANPGPDDIAPEPAVRERLAAFRARFDAAAAGAREAADRAAADRAVVQRLEQIRAPTGDGVDPFDFPRMRTALEELFAELGLPVDDYDNTAAALRGHRLGGALGPALDQWALLNQVRSGLPDEERGRATARLLWLASMADPDPQREAIRRAARERDTGKLREIAATAVEQLPPQSVILLAGMLRILGELDASVDLLRRAAGRHSSDFWLSFHTAIALRAQAARSGKKAFPLLLESLSFLRAAVAARPESAEARHLIGQTLEQVGRRDLARDEFAELVRRAPQDGHALTHLGNAIFDFEGPAAALPYLQRAAALSPDDTYCLVNCARALVATGDVWAALPLNRRAWELDPTADHATRYANALGATGDEAGQLAMREQVLAQTPDDYVELYNTATSYSGIGEFERAEGMLRRCIELVGDGLPQAHCNLASTLLKRGRFEAALAAYRDCHRLGSAKPGWQDPSAEWVARAERAVAFARALGDADDAAAAQALEPSVERAEFAAFLGRHALATRWNESLYAALAPAQWPREHVDLAARAAVRTAAAATDPGAADHAAQLALAWLGTLQDLLMADFRARPRDEAGPVRSWLGAWHQHADLAWLRDIDALPEALREQVRGFWARLDRDLAEIVTAMQR